MSLDNGRLSPTIWIVGGQGRPEVLLAISHVVKCPSV